MILDSSKNIQNLGEDKIKSIMNIKYYIFLFLLVPVFLNAQYDFKEVKKLECTDIKSQDKTGTCWSFATTSFLESEILRIGIGEADISEMFIVSNIYQDKARNYLLRQGKANFSQGALSHDAIRAFDQFGAVPESVFSGLKDREKHNHSEMEAALKGMLDGILKQKRLSTNWQSAVRAVLDVYIGSAEQEFIVGGKQMNPKSYAKLLGINADDYLSLTSFTHHPFYESFILEIPDNYSNGAFYNLPIDELEKVVDHAVKNGYSIAWDGDVGEKGFSAKEGIAVLPTDEKREDLFKKPGAELSVTQSARQANFESFATTDDHLMHLVGTAKDKDGDLYYIIKNSWNKIGPYNGYVYMSKPYFKMKTMAILLHKDAIPKQILKKIKF